MIWEVGDEKFTGSWLLLKPGLSMVMLLINYLFIVMIRILKTAALKSSDSSII